jgi:hypothetical protein
VSYNIADKVDSGYGQSGESLRDHSVMCKAGLFRFLMGSVRTGKEKQAPCTHKTYCTPWLRAQRRRPVRNNPESYQLLHVDPRGALIAIDRAHLVQNGGQSRSFSSGGITTRQNESHLRRSYDTVEHGCVAAKSAMLILQCFASVSVLGCS